MQHRAFLTVAIPAAFLHATRLLHAEIDPEVNAMRAFNVDRGERVVWRVTAGESTGAVALKGGKVLVGSRFSGPSNTTIDGSAAMNCFSSETGQLLWQADHRPLLSRTSDMGLPIVSTPWIEDKLAWYISNRGELVCVSMESLDPDRTEADIIWKLDMVQELGVYKRGAGDVGSPSGSPVVLGDLVYCVTGEGCRRMGDLGSAPSFIAVNKSTGQVVWSSSAPGQDIIYAQWSSPVIAHVSGSDQVIFPGGDGWLYGFEPKTGELLWKQDCNEPTAIDWKIDRRNIRIEEGKMKLFFMGAPVVHEETLFVGLTIDIERRAGDGPLLGISLQHPGDEAEKAFRWKFSHPDFANTHGPAAVADGIVYVLGSNAVLFALDEKTGKELWHSKFFGDSHSWFYGGPIISNGKILVGGEEGELIIYAAGPEKKCLARYEFPEPLYNMPVVDKEFIYITGGQYLWKLRLP